MATAMVYSYLWREVCCLDIQPQSHIAGQMCIFNSAFPCFPTISRKSKKSRKKNHIFPTVSSVERCSLPDPPFMLHPLSTAKYIWDWAVVAVVLYNAVIVPWNLAFKLNKKCESNMESDACQTSWDQGINIALDIFFWVDIVLAFRTGYIDQKKNVYMDPRATAKNYVRRWFFLDLVANFPIELIGAVVVQSGSSRGLLALQLFRVPRLLRVVRLLRCEYHRPAPTMFHLIKMTLVFLLISHWCGCLWFFVGRWQAENIGANEFTGGVTWIEVQLGESSDGGDPPTYRNANFQTKYTASIYWALTTMSTVGYGDILPKTNIERFFTMLVQFLGAICTALILGNVAVLIANLDNSASRFRDRMDTIDEFIKAQNVPGVLAERMRESLRHSWFMQQGLDVNTVLAELPENLKTSVLMHMQCNVVEGSYLFKRCDKAFVKAIVFRLRAQEYLPGDFIAKATEASLEMYFIRYGRVKIMGEGDVIYGLLDEGDLFGELEIFSGKRRKATVQALTSVELYALPIRDFEEVLEEFPEYYAPLKAVCEKRANEFAQRRIRRDQNFKENVENPVEETPILRSLSQTLPSRLQSGVDASDSSDSSSEEAPINGLQPQHTGLHHPPPPLHIPPPPSDMAVKVEDTDDPGFISSLEQLIESRVDTCTIEEGEKPRPPSRVHQSQAEERISRNENPVIDTAAGVEKIEQMLAVIRKAEIKQTAVINRILLLASNVVKQNTPLEA